MAHTDRSRMTAAASWLSSDSTSCRREGSPAHASLRNASRADAIAISSKLVDSRDLMPTLGSQIHL